VGQGGQKMGTPMYAPALAATAADAELASLKGSWPVSSCDNITIRATQKKRMSEPVSRRSPGKKSWRSAVARGHPREANG
jgi:hypothetical protein